MCWIFTEGKHILFASVTFHFSLKKTKQSQVSFALNSSYELEVCIFGVQVIPLDLKLSKESVGTWCRGGIYECDAHKHTPTFRTAIYQTGLTF